MTIYCLGSLNADHIYHVPHLPHPGETLAAAEYQVMAGGKGLNQSIAAAKAGVKVVHMGAIGADGVWLRDILAEAGVDVSQIAQVDASTGHAVITVAKDAENSIVIFPGANHAIPLTTLKCLDQAQPNDWFLTQNETNAQVQAAERARSRGMKVLYCAAPFSATAVKAMVPFADVLVLNAVEMQQLSAAMELPKLNIIVTHGAAGCEVIRDQSRAHIPAPRVTAVDSTGAGDVFAGTLAAALDQGLGLQAAAKTAICAATVMVTRKGTAEAIPSAQEVLDYFANAASDPQS